MNKKNRLAQDNKVEIIDKKSPYFGKTGTVKDIRSQLQQMIGFNSKTIKSTTIYYVVVKFDEIETPQVFTSEQVRKYPELKDNQD